MAEKKAKVDVKRKLPRSTYLLYLKAAPNDRSQWIFGTSAKDLRDAADPGRLSNEFGVVRFIRADIAIPGGSA